MMIDKLIGIHAIESLPPKPIEHSFGTSVEKAPFSIHISALHIWVLNMENLTASDIVVISTDIIRTEMMLI